MLAPVEAAFRTALSAAVTDWPIRWANDQWEQIPAGWMIGDGNMPLDADGAPGAAIEVEVIGGQASATAGPKGKRRGRLSGLFRCYLSVPQGSGLADITAKSDAIADAFRRVTVWSDPVTSQRLIAMDPRVDDGVAAYEDGSRFCRMVSIPWDFDFPD